MFDRVLSTPLQRKYFGALNVKTGKQDVFINDYTYAVPLIIINVNVDNNNYNNNNNDNNSNDNNVFDTDVMIIII